MKKYRKIISVLLLCSLFMGFLPKDMIKAAEYTCSYVTSKDGTLKYCYCPDDAFQACDAAGGGKIWFLQNHNLNLWPTLRYATIGTNVSIYVNPDIQLTIGEFNLHLNGTIYVSGSLDLQKSDGIIFGDGQIVTTHAAASYAKKKYDIGKNGDIAFTANNVTYGQNLGDAAINPNAINWHPSVAGSWQYASPNSKPQIGTHSYGVKYTPENLLSYEIMSFTNAGQVTMVKATPRLVSSELQTAHYGENLLKYSPKCSYVNPITNGNVEGNTVFEQPNQILNKVGEQTFMSVFTPNDSENNEVVKNYVTLQVETTKPEIVAMPECRNQGAYGQRLSDIRLLPGKCINPYTKEEVTGKWEWKDSSERLVLGEKPYNVLFLPDNSGYENQEVQVNVVTLPQVMQDITWPQCSDIFYGEPLSSSELSFAKNEYGTFSWENDKTKLDVKNKGARLVFTPTNSDIYDWSKLDGYDEETKTVRYHIPVRVKPLLGEIHQITADALMKGDSLSSSSIHYAGSNGKIEWKNPNQIPAETGEFDAIFTPNDSSNYDWSACKPDVYGRIPLKVGVDVLPCGKIIQETKIGQRLKDIPIQIETEGLSCEWKDGSTVLERAGKVELPVKYSWKNFSWERTIAFEVNKLSQEAPKGLTALEVSEENLSDGCILGVSDSMEYRKGDGDYIAIAQGNAVIGGLSSGDYEVRNKETSVYYASEPAIVKVRVHVKPTPTPTLEPTPTPTLEPTPTPTMEPTQVPTIEPTVEPTIAPTVEPTLEPTIAPTVEPTLVPTVEPTIAPTVEPTLEPTIAPTVEPTLAPTEEPTLVPTIEPTLAPTAEPTLVPTIVPTIAPTVEPTLVPTVVPTVVPTIAPTVEPTLAPTQEPTATPTSVPTVTPTQEPTWEPTPTPSMKPSQQPTITPTVQPISTPTLIPTSTPSPTSNSSYSGVEDYEPIIITKIASKISSIVSPSSIARTKIKKVSRSKHKAKLHWTKVKGARYEVQFGRSKKWKRSKRLYFKKNTAVINRIAQGRKYYFRVRAYKLKNTKKVFGKWSKTRKVS